VSIDGYIDLSSPGRTPLEYFNGPAAANYRTQTRTEIAGTACSGSAKFPAGQHDTLTHTDRVAPILEQHPAREMVC
jgi:hypothetical protein